MKTILSLATRWCYHKTIPKKPNHIPKYLYFTCAYFQGKSLNIKILVSQCLLPTYFVFLDLFHVCILGCCFFFGASYLLPQRRSTKSIVLKSIHNVSNIIFQKYEIIYFYLYSWLLFICFLLFNRKEISCSWTSVNVTMTEQALGKIINSITGWKNIFVKLARWSLFFLTIWISMCWKFCLASRENKQLRNFSKIHRNWEQTLTKHHSQMIWHPSHCIRWSCVQRVRLLIITASWGSEKFQDRNAATCLEPKCNIEGPEDPQCVRG